MPIVPLVVPERHRAALLILDPRRGKLEGEPGSDQQLGPAFGSCMYTCVLISQALLNLPVHSADDTGGQQGKRKASWREAGHGLCGVHKCYPVLVSYAHSAGDSQACDQLTLFCCGLCVLIWSSFRGSLLESILSHSIVKGRRSRSMSMPCHHSDHQQGLPTKFNSL